MGKMLWAEKYLVSWDEEERRRIKSKYLEKENIWSAEEKKNGERKEKSILRRKIFDQRRRKRTEKKKGGKYSEKEKGSQNFLFFWVGGWGVMGVGSRGRILYHLYENVNLVEICCEIASDVLSAYDVFPFFALNSLRQFITPLCAKTEQDYQQKTFHFCFTFYKGYFERKMQ